MKKAAMTPIQDTDGRYKVNQAETKRLKALNQLRSK